MKLVRVSLRSFDASTKLRQQLCKARPLSTNAPLLVMRPMLEMSQLMILSKEYLEDCQATIQLMTHFIKSLIDLKKARGRPGFNSDMDRSGTGGSNSSLLDGLDDSSTLSDGKDGKLKNAANYFEFDPEEINSEDYAFRPDVTFRRGMTYEPKDLDLTKPGVCKPFKRYEFEVTTEETRISAKAQRKVAREIKTARAFGLMPFTTMGQDPFVYGQTRDEEKENEEDEYEDPISPEDLI